MKENKINKDDTPEEIERKKMYAKLCANKKPYFFAYNYTYLKTEYDAFMKNVRSNAISLYKKDLDTMIAGYQNGTLSDDNEKRFIENYYYKLPLDMSKSTMNKICWAIEKEFDGVDLFKDVVFDYSVLKSNIKYNQDMFNLIKHICSEYKPSVLMSNKNAAINMDDEDKDWQSVDILLQNLVEELHSCCPNEDELCEILVDLCYGENISKQILWKTCGNTIVNRLLKSHENKISYPKRSNNGEFWCQGIQYEMREIVVGGEQDETV